MPEKFYRPIFMILMDGPKTHSTMQAFSFTLLLQTVEACRLFLMSFRLALENKRSVHHIYNERRSRNN